MSTDVGEEWLYWTPECGESRMYFLSYLPGDVFTMCPPSGGGFDVVVTSVDRSNLRVGFRRIAGTA